MNWSEIYDSVDVTEAQFTMIGLLMTTSFYGTGVWETEVGILVLD